MTTFDVHILFILCQDVPSVTSTVVFNPNHCVSGIKNHCYNLLSVTVLLLYVPCNFSENNTLFILIVMVLSNFFHGLQPFIRVKEHLAYKNVISTNSQLIYKCFSEWYWMKKIWREMMQKYH